MRLAHISDLHVLDLDSVTWTRFLNKRVTGLANLGTFRRHAHPVRVFDCLAETLRTAEVDHVAATGDITNLALESEFARARQGFERIGGDERLSIIPGNHDIYTRGSAVNHRFESYFEKWMGSITRSAGGQYHYPFAKRIGDIALFGLCSAFPTLPLTSYGAVDAPQRQRLVELAHSSEFAGAFKVALIHHNLHTRGSTWKDWHSGMKELRALVDAFFDAGVQLVLHGHTHVAHRFAFRRRQRMITVIGCGSSTWVHGRHPARFNVYTIQGGQLGLVERHVYSEGESRFIKDDVNLRVELVVDV